MKPETTVKSSRKKFLVWTAAILSSIGLYKILPVAKENKNITDKPTVKMLTQDGRLVEIDKNLVASSGKKITNEEMQQWIKK